MIAEADIEKALDYLRDRAKLYGQLCGHVAFAEGNLRRIKALEMLGREGSVAQREIDAYASAAYLEALKQQQDAVTERETERALRDAAEYKIEVWRSQSSAAKRGNI